MAPRFRGREVRSFRNHLFGEGYTVSVPGAQKVEDLMLMDH